MKYLYLLLFSILSGAVYAQQCGTCGNKPKIAMYELDVQVPKPESEGNNASNSWLDLHHITSYANSRLFEINKNCVSFIQALSISDKKEVELQLGTITQPRLPQEGNLSQMGTYRYDYIVTGSVQQQGTSYVVNLQIQNACNRNTIASVSIPFQATSEYKSIGEQAANRLSPLIGKINEYEFNEREENSKVALGNNGLDNRIQIKPKKNKLASGEETEIELTMLDCDGNPLKDREISFSASSVSGFAIKGTTGGKVTPSRVTTDMNGKAKAIFKMGSDNTAIINAHYLFAKPNCSEYAKIGTYPIGGIPVMVEVVYSRDETTTRKTGSYLAMEEVGEIAQVEQTVMNHRTIAYHYPTAGTLKEGFVVKTDKRKSGAITKTEYISESGSYSYVSKANDVVMNVGNDHIQATVLTQEGNKIEAKGVASLKNPSDLYFFKGDENEKPYFIWAVNYPNQFGSDPEDVVGGDVRMEKGEPGVVWQVKKITDPNILYKTEYLLSLDLDAAAEYKKVDENLGGVIKAFESLFTKPGQDSLVDIVGHTSIMVRILSPYAD